MAAIGLKGLVSGVKRGAVFGYASLNHLLWPAVCLSCRENISEGDDGLCRRCWGELLACSGGDYCRRCGRDVSRFGIVEGACPDCQGEELYFDGIARGGVYEKALRDLILAFKLGGWTELDAVLGFLANSAFEGSGFADEVEIFVPVPMHWTRRLARGYNQSHVIAGRLKGKGTKVSTDLVRVRRTKVQASRASAASRARNVAGAFAVRRGHKFGGRVICLVDDIKTTGATLNECARTLKEAGASKVYAVTPAVAGQKKA